MRNFRQGSHRPFTRGSKFDDRGSIFRLRTTKTRTANFEWGVFFRGSRFEVRGSKFEVRSARSEVRTSSMGVEIMRVKPWKRDIVESEDWVAMDRLPRHIAIIMDGNGRWAQKRALPRSMGHRAGVEALRQIVKTCSKLKIQVLTVYAFSTENWRRPKDEVGVLMTLLTEYLRKELLELQQNNVIIRTMGKINDLPLEAQHELAHAMESTRENTGLILNLALNYGGRAEIIDTVKSLSKEVLSGKLRIEEIDEQRFGESLYTRGLPDPDMLIRTSGEIRLSNFLLWQLAYTEIVVVEELWPDFGQKALIEAIKAYQKRDRRFGGIHTN